MPADLMQAVQQSGVTLQPVSTVETSLIDFFNLKHNDVERSSAPEWGKVVGKWRPKLTENDVCLTRPPHEAHGQCYGFQAERDKWEAPRLVTHSLADARPGYDTCSASEYLDVDATLRAKVTQLARLIMASKRCVFYAGAGLSTSAGIDDYASQGTSISKEGGANVLSPLCAQPTLAHRVLVGLYKAGHCHRIVQQNHGESRTQRTEPFYAMSLDLLLRHMSESC